MKLCWLLPNDKSGGISPVVLSCCRQAAQAGHKTTMLFLNKPSWLTSNQFQVSSLGLPNGATETPKMLLQWSEQNPQDVLFFNGCEEFDVIIPYLSAKIKCVYVVHDTAPSYWLRAIAQEEALEAIVAVSETVASKFRHQLKHPEKLSVIYNGCVFPEIERLNYLREDDLIFLGGENPTKGAFDILNLWKSLIKLGFKGKLHWFGNLTPKFINKIRQLPNYEQIKIYGYVPRDVIFSTAASAKVILMLSRVEPFGMATIEAMGMGCIPVAWDVETGTKEIATANETGLFAPLGDTHNLAQKVIFACENYQAFNHAVIECARSKFNETVMWQGYESLIEKISTLPAINRSKQGQQPALYQPPIRRFQLLPTGLRAAIRELIGLSPTLGYLVRDLRGW